MLPADFHDNSSDMEHLLKSEVLDYEERIMSSSPMPRQQPRMNFKELECDISIEGATTRINNNHRQEFSFTLYDFDGHGKVTKDDIAGLVTTIYETLGSSIRVPQNGSKTIKVKLTVTPTLTEDVKTKPNDPSPPASLLSCKPKKEHKERKSYKKRRRQRPCSLSSSTPSENREADVSDAEEGTHPRLTESFQPLLPRSKKRSSSSLQRQELLQIIQANMEKNNLSYINNRKVPNWDKEKTRLTNNLKYEKLQKPPSSTPQQHPFILRSSSHHYKHRHREIEQARAMAQVVRWLEKEFSDTKNKSDCGYSKFHQQKNTSSYVPHHEHCKHHHVHEHVHHHYHHYHDSPVLIKP